MRSRVLGGVEVGEIGLGCMNLNHAYGVVVTPQAAQALIGRALELGITHFDTAALYGFGKNESMLGPILAPYRQRIYLASKCGMTGVDGKRVIDGRPETIKKTCLEALSRLNTDVIDMYYLHRWDRKVPIEDSVGALSDLLKAGHIRSIGLSEVSCATLRRAYAVHPIAAVQSEYSIWTRDPEVMLLEECARLNVSLVAFSPLTRGFLLGAITSPDQLAPKDIRREMPRFAEPNFSSNIKLLQPLQNLAREAGCTPAQLALAWLLQRAPQVIAIPGTTSIAHLEEDAGASGVTLSAAIVQKLEQLVNSHSVKGTRYNAATQAEVDADV